MDLNHRSPRIDTSRHSMVPRQDVPRSTFVTQHSLKTTFDAGYLVPFHVDEVLPGDTHKGRVTVFARLATPVFPIMDSITLDTFFFFVPNRLLWENWKKMMGERANPDSSIDFTTPQIVSPAGGFAILSLADYFGLPTVGQVGGAQDVSVSALPFRAYNFIYNEWFRDQNLQNSLVVDTDNGPDTLSDYVLRKRNKKHDYFTSCLPYPLKGGTEVTLPLSGNAPVMGIAYGSSSNPIDGTPANYYEVGGTLAVNWTGHAPGGDFYIRTGDDIASVEGPEVYADLSSVTGATINALRLAFQTQRLLERDMRSGTRYTELLRAHFGVTPEDTRLQRPEYIGGGTAQVQTQAIAQTGPITSETAYDVGRLGATQLVTDQHSFNYSATEHGWIIGLVNVRAELTYQQGLHKMWTRSTRYDYYWPVFAHLGEQAVYRKEIYCTGDPTNDDVVFGYQERWAEYRHKPSRITGLFRSTSAGTIEQWHLAEEFSSAPSLNSAFITDMSNVVLERAVASGSLADGLQIMLDAFFQIRLTRALPMFSVPGMTDQL